MPQETLLALGAIVAIVIGAVALLEGSTTSGRDEGDRIVDSVRGLLDETGALAAGRAVGRLLANRPVRQARRPRTIPVAYPTPAGRTTTSGAPSVGGVAPVAVAQAVDEEGTDAWSLAGDSSSGDRPPTQPNRIIVSGVRARGRGLFRRSASDSVLPPRARAGAVRPGPVSTRLRRSRSGARVLQALSALLLVALLALLGVLVLRPQGDSGVLGATSAPSDFVAAAPTVTPSPSPSPSPTPTPKPKPTPTPTRTTRPRPTPTPIRPKPSPSRSPTATPTPTP